MVLLMVELPNLQKPDHEEPAFNHNVAITMTRHNWLRLLWAADVLCQFLATVPFPTDSLNRLKHSVELLHLAISDND